VVELWDGMRKMLLIPYSKASSTKETRVAGEQCHTTALAIKAAASNFDAFENGIHEEEGCFSSPASRQAQLRKQEQHVNNVTPTALANKAAASNVDAVENGIHEEEDDSEIRNKGELVRYRDGSFVFGMLKKMNLNDSKLKSYNTFEQMDTALKKGSQNGGVFAIVDELPYIRGLLFKYCTKYTITSAIYKTTGFAFTFPKGSPLVLDFSRAFLQVTEEQMKNISKQMFGEAASCIQQRVPTVTTDRLSLDSFKGLFLIANHQILLS
nr:glutamate receptor 2.1 [Tanacetum cinerariifolium]